VHGRGGAGLRAAAPALFAENSPPDCFHGAHKRRDIWGKIKRGGAPHAQEPFWAKPLPLRELAVVESGPAYSDTHKCTKTSRKALASGGHHILHPLSRWPLMKAEIPMRGLSMSTADYHRGITYSHIAIMGACPGRQEERESRPFSGRTGTQLKNMLSLLPCNIFPSGELIEFTLMNSHDKPMYKPSSKTTIPKINDIAKPRNITRLQRQLKEADVSILLCLGKEAQRASELLRTGGHLTKARIFCCGHPSPRHLNCHYRNHPMENRLEAMVRKCFSPLIWNDKEQHFERSNH